MQDPEISSRPGIPPERRFLIGSALSLALTLVSQSGPFLFAKWTHATWTGGAVLILATALLGITEGFSFYTGQPTKSQLHQDGAYAHCRHPKEISYWLALTGLSITGNSLWPLVVLPTLAGVLMFRATTAEEKRLTHQHRRIHVTYRREVPRFGWRFRGTALTLRATPFCLSRVLQQTTSSALNMAMLLPCFVIICRSRASSSASTTWWTGDATDLTLIAIAGIAATGRIIAKQLPATGSVAALSSRLD